MSNSFYDDVASTASPQNQYQKKQFGFNKGGNFKKKEFDPNTPMKIYKPYVMIANKEAPIEIQDIAKTIAKDLMTNGYILRTSHNEGLERELESLSIDKEIYIPWKGFDNVNTKEYYSDVEHFAMTALFVPNFKDIKEVAQKMMARSTRMLLGAKLKSNAMALICWSADGCENYKNGSPQTGFLRLPIQIANSIPIPVFNLQNKDARERIYKYFNIQYLDEDIAF